MAVQVSRQTGSTKRTEATRRYPSLAAFYESDPQRLRSREHDVGLWWRQGPDDPLHRAAWVCDTGELYLMRLGEAGGAIEVLVTVATFEQLERLVDGWREHCGEPRSLAWLRERARGWAGTRRSRFVCAPFDGPSVA